MVTLKNNVISIEISTTGAEMKKITVNGKERLWNGDPSFWSGTAPVMFPICGGLPEDKFTYNGREYYRRCRLYTSRRSLYNRL